MTMEREFNITQHFDSSWKKFGLTEDDLRKLQDSLLFDPIQGDTLTKKGVRKTRFAREGRGKSGDVRVIYVDFPKKEILFLLTVFLKKNQESLTNQQKNQIDKVVSDIEYNLQIKR
jgi:mRNA-degrading endonuclease RelE of RelBE toxin-antitoxin system